nr:hypothetical protein [Paraburkholderia unamae]
MYLEFADEGAQLGLVVRQCLVVQALAIPTQCYCVILAFTDVDTNEDIDGVMLLEFLHRSLCRLNELACNNGGKSRHPRYGRPWNNPAEPLLAITSHPPDPVTTPPDHDCDWGRESCRAWLAKTSIIEAGR